MYNVVPAGLSDGPDGIERLSDVKEADYDRLKTGPWDICFGGGIVVGSTTLIGGAPGAGKSTMSLQLADSIAANASRPVYYIAAEEANRDIKARAKRLGLKHFDKILMHNLMTVEGDLVALLKKYNPAAFILDSLTGTVGEDLNAAVALATQLKPVAVQAQAPCIIIDHINKQLDFTGRMGLQHAVDTTITLFPVDDGPTGETRELKTVKNRFGPAGVFVEFDMTENGLVMISADDNDEEDEETQNPGLSRIAAALTKKGL